MSAPVLHVVARVKARPETVAEVGQILKSLVEPTRREAGCLSYELLHNEADPTDFCFVERWRDVAALDAHFATPHFVSAISRVPALLAAEPQVCRYRVLA